MSEEVKEEGSFKVKKKPGRPKKLTNKGETIKVLTSDYLANGGDKMWFFKDKIQTKVEIKLRDAIINYCKSHKVISSKLDWRIRLVNTIK